MKMSVFVGASVDGFIARDDHGLDFLMEHEGEAHGFDEFFATVDCLLMGRNTYDVVCGFPQWLYGAKTVFVLSSREIPPPPPGGKVERIAGEAHDVFSELEARGFRHVYVDGGRTIQEFLRAGLVDRIIVTRVPVLIGSGIPLFGPLERDIKLTHVSTRTFPSGLVQTEYAIAK